MDESNKSKNLESKFPTLSRVKKVFAAGWSSFLFGLILRFNANNIAWPNEWSYSGARANTQWAITEIAIMEVALLIMALGLVLVVLSVIKYLFADSRYHN